MRLNALHESRHLPPHTSDSRRISIPEHSMQSAKTFSLQRIPAATTLTELGPFSRSSSLEVAAGVHSGTRSRVQPQTLRVYRRRDATYKHAVWCQCAIPSECFAANVSGPAYGATGIPSLRRVKLNAVIPNQVGQSTEPIRPRLTW